MVQLARLSKQSIVQFVKQNESVFLETNLSNSLAGLNTLVDLDELLLTTSIASQQLKRRYSPDFLLDNENQFNSAPNKRFHSLNASSIKLNSAAHQQSNGHQQSINQPIGQQTTTSTNSSSIANSGGSLTNPSILQSHLTQARTSMLEELMSNRFYQTPIQQQFNLINQHLNQQIHGGHKLKQQQPNLLHANGIVNGLNSMSNQMSGQMIGGQLNGNQLSGHLQANLLLNNQLNLSKQQLERLALLERYDKEIALQSKQPNLNNLRSTIESNLINSHNLRAGGLAPPIALAQTNQLANGLNLNNSMPSHQMSNQKKVNATNASSNELNNEEEWKTIDTMLNCIISMVEKTKRALNVLQQKNQESLVQRESNSPADWQRNAKMPTSELQPMKTINKNLKLNTAQQNLPMQSSTPPTVTLDGDYLDLRKSTKDPLFSSLNFNTNPTVPKMSLNRLNRINAQTGKYHILDHHESSIINVDHCS